MTEQTKAGKSVSVLVKEAFLKLLPVQIAGIIVGAINTFVDSVVTGQFLGTEAMAAIGFFGPVATVIGISYVLIIGIQILCGRHIGAGEGAEVVSLFSTGAVFLGAFNISIGVIDFCKARNIDQRRSMVAGLCVEEMVGNVVKHGFLPGEKHAVDVRIVVKEKLTIRVRDDCRAFDPPKASGAVRVG